MNIHGICLTIFLLLSMPSLMQAQKNVFKVSPLGLFILNLSVGYERSINQNNAIEIGLRANIGNIIRPNPEAPFPGLGGYLGYKYYFLKKHTAPRGLYFNARVGYDRNSMPILFWLNGTPNYEIINANGAFGYQWIIPKNGNEGFTINLRLGLSYLENLDRNFDNFIEGYYPLLGIEFGYAWD